MIINTFLKDSNYNRVNIIFPDINATASFLFYFNTSYNDILGFSESALYFNLEVPSEGFGVVNPLLTNKRLISGYNFLEHFSGFGKLFVQGDVPTLDTIDKITKLIYEPIT